MAKPVHLPSVIGCAFGFAVAGCGIGSVAGMALGHWLYPPLLEDQRPIKIPLDVVYSGTYFGIRLGFVLGAVTGVLYALLVRRSRLRRWSADAGN